MALPRLKPSPRLPGKAVLIFLADTVRRWEEEASKAEEFEVRAVFCRFGIILEKNDGALPRMALPYKIFAGELSEQGANGFHGFI